MSNDFVTYVWHNTGKRLLIPVLNKYLITIPNLLCTKMFMPEHKRQWGGRVLTTASSPQVSKVSAGVSPVAHLKFGLWQWRRDQTPPSCGPRASGVQLVQCPIQNLNCQWISSFVDAPPHLLEQPPHFSLFLNLAGSS